MVVTERFVNEIGNHITVKVQKKNIRGTNYRTGRKSTCDGVLITMIGPTSEMTNEITIDEAKVLFVSLGKVIF